MKPPVITRNVVPAANLYSPGCVKAFTLIEVAFSLGIVSFALVSIMGLLSFGLTTCRNAISSTVESHIVQAISNDILLTDFANLASLADRTYAYDNEGRLVTAGGDSVIYTTKVTFQPLDNLQSFPVKLQSVDGSETHNEAFNVLIEITDRTRPDRKTKCSIIVANNNI